MVTEVSKQPALELVPTHVLDFMRGVAAVYVVVNHVRGNFFKGGARTMSEALEPLGLYDYISISILQLTSLGTEFVILFFCVSGYAMAHSMLHTPSALQFYQRRLIRIWPPYLLAIGLAAIVCLLYVWMDPASRVSQKCADGLCSAEGLFLMATYIKVATPITAQFWSLPYEVIFYFLCPLLLWRQSAIPAVFGISALLSLVSIPFWGIELNPSDSILVNFAINAAFWFMSGVVAYHNIAAVPLLSGRVFALTGSLLFVLILVVKTWYGAPNAISNLLMIIFSVLCIRNLPRSWTSKRLWNWGFFSYSIYIFHMAFLQLIVLMLDQQFNIRALDIESYWTWLLFLPIILVGCWGMYYLGESKCNKLLKRMKQPKVKHSGLASQ